MILVVPFCGFDAEEALRLFRWIGDLDPIRPEPRLLLICDAHTPWHLAREVITAAKACFDRVHFHATEKSVTGWPAGPNSLFGEASKIAAGWGEPFLWMEPDCVPVRRRWLEEISEEYARCGKPYLGALIQCSIPGLPPVHLNGNAVYPHTAHQDLRAAWESDRAWDMTSASDVVPQAAKSRCIQHFWGMPHLPPTFREDESDGDPVNTLYLRTLSKHTALFHRNKDGTLIDLLRRKMEKPTRLDGFPYFRVYSAEAEAVCVVQLGRYGDILNILPICWSLAQETNGRINLMVSEKFADLPRHCTYVNPIIWPGPFEQLHQAVAQANQDFDRVVVTQIYGNRYLAPQKTQSFIQESWRVSGYLEKWNQLPLVIDGRDRKREAAWINSVLEVCQAREGPIILTNFFGYSSPMLAGAELTRTLEAHVKGRATVINLEVQRAPRFVDLLGLYDRADLLVTGDTGTLHLARASSISTVEFYTSTPTAWYGTGEPRGNDCLFHCRYPEVEKSVPKVLEAVDQVLGREPNLPVFHLVYSEYQPRDFNTIRRQAMARGTWTAITSTNPRFRLCPVEDQMLPRIFRDGDKRKIPYIKDLIEHAAGKAKMSDYIVLFNADICMGPQVPDALRYAARKQVPLFASRRDFRRLDGQLTADQIKAGQHYPGIDFFAFPKKWWLSFRHEIPDMLLGTEAWDMVMARVIQENGGIRRDGIVYHEMHSAFWNQQQNRTRSQSQQHNRRLAFGFLNQRSLDPATYGLR